MMTYLIKKKGLLIVTLMAILFFIFLSVSFAFPDLFALFFVPNFIFNGNPYILTNLHQSVCAWSSAPYPPLYFYFVGFYMKLIQSLHLLPASFFEFSRCPVFEMLTSKQFLFFAKLHYLVFHLASAFFFSRLFDKKRSLWFFVWLLNPLAIFVSFIEGQFEIIPTLFMIIFLYLVKQKKNLSLAFLALGIGGAFKNFPFLLLFPSLLVVTKDSLSRVKLFVLAVVPYLLSIVPVFGQDFLNTLSFSENYAMFLLGIIWGKAAISFYIVLYTLGLLLAALEKKADFNTLVKYLFLASIFFFLTAPWSPQRILFLLPTLLVVASTRKKIRFVLPGFYIFYFLYVFTIYPGLFDHSLLRPWLSNIVSIDYNFLSAKAGLISTTVVSVIIAIFIWWSLQVLADHKGEEVEDKERFVVKSFLPLLFYLAIILILIPISGTR